MTTSAVSQSPALLVGASVFGTIFLGFGINAMLRPRAALAFFELGAPASAAEQTLVDALMTVYGARDVFMGLAMYATAYAGDRAALGCLLVAGSGVALVDGFVCWRYAGKGEWSHWGYAPMLTAVGSVLLGVLDGK
ncbi:alpha beta hydrolase fold-3 domain protein [Phlyctema vagabunda]|uniref:Alpha beta hydrolase fold-3 domain protein n=1 Tax=Phlyctema vagabunda TaxID=108571 RepID=A0ABR4P6R9_9HELO